MAAKRKAKFASDDTFTVDGSAANGFYAFCRHPKGDCAPFMTSGWTTAEQAEKRIREHLREHDEGVLMTPMDEFCATHAPELLPG